MKVGPNGPTFLFRVMFPRYLKNVNTVIFEGISKKPLHELQSGVKTAIISANDIASTNIMAFQEILLQIEHLKLEGRVHIKKPDSFAELHEKV